MMTTLFLRIQELDFPAGSECLAQWQLYDEEGAARQHNNTSVPLAEIAAKMRSFSIKEYTLVVILKGQDVLVSEVKIGDQYTKHTQSAILSALEEQLAEPLEQVHVAVGKTGLEQEDGISPNTYTVCVINHRWMHNMNTALSAAALLPDAILPESLLLPFADGKGSVAIDSGSIVFRFSPTLASTLAPEAFLDFLAAHLDQRSSLAEDDSIRSYDALHTLTLFVEAGQEQQNTPFITRLIEVCKEHKITLEQAEADGGIFPWLTEQAQLKLVSGSVINLMQGQYQVRGWLRALLAHKRAVMGIVLIWFLLQIVLDAGQIVYLKYKASDFSVQTENIYHSLFPGDSKIVDLRSQTEQHIKDNTFIGDSGPIGLLRIFTVNKALTHQLKVESLSYDAAKNQIIVTVTPDDVSQLNKLKEAANAANVTVDTTALPSGSAGVHGTIIIKGKGL